MVPAQKALPCAALAGAAAVYLWLRRRRVVGSARESVVKHIVLVDLKPGTPAAAIDAMLAALRDLPRRIPTIVRIDVGRQVAALDDGRNASIGGVVEFASEADYASYAKHPAHVDVIKRFILPHMVERGRAAIQIAAAPEWTPQTYTGGGGLTRGGRRRVCFGMRFDPSRLDDYKRRHEAVWLDMQEALVRSGFRDYSLFCRKDGYAVGYFEAAAGRTLEECAALMAREPVNERWQTSMEAFTVSGGKPDEETDAFEHYFFLGADRIG